MTGSRTRTMPMATMRRCWTRGCGRVRTIMTDLYGWSCIAKKAGREASHKIWSWRARKRCYSNGQSWSGSLPNHYEMVATSVSTMPASNIKDIDKLKCTCLESPVWGFHQFGQRLKKMCPQSNCLKHDEVKDNKTGNKNQFLLLPLWRQYMVGLGPGGNVDWMKFLMELIISSILIANPKFTTNTNTTLIRACMK